MRVIIAALAVSAGLAAPAAAETVYDCGIKVFTNNGWIAPRVFVFWDEKARTAKIYDGIVDTVYGEPIDAKVIPRSEKSVTLSWEVKGIPVSNRVSAGEAKYNGVFNWNNMTLSVTGAVSGADNSPRGRGKCKLHKG